MVFCIRLELKDILIVRDLMIFFLFHSSHVLPNIIAETVYSTTDRPKLVKLAIFDGVSGLNCVFRWV